MQLTSLNFLLSLLAALVTGNELAPTAAAIIEPRAESNGLYTCTKPKWGGDCKWHRPGSVSHPDYDLCMPMPYPDSEKISFGPDNGLLCVIYRDQLCLVDGKKLKYPGADDVPGMKFPGGNGFKSFTCRVKVL